jgi:predicted LPLAT superfamily acyltransferase
MNAYWDEQRERSTRAALRLMIWASLFFGRYLIHLVLWPIAVYFLLTSRNARRASRQALTRLTGRDASWLDVTRHFYCFGVCAVDRLYLLKNRRSRISIDVTRGADVSAIAARSGGCLLLVAHLGSFEAIRMLGTAERRLPISILMDRKQGQKLLRLFEQINPGFALQIIDAASRGPELVLRLKEALAAGRMVCIMGDRARADERAVTVNFCEHPARFPLGPWALASALGVPVLLGFVLYRGGRRYSAHFEVFAKTITMARDNRQAELHALVQRFANRLEYHAKLAPRNWFNFYDFWTDKR